MSRVIRLFQGSLVFGTWNAVVEERDGGDWTGSPSSGNVMDLA
jgi:hypothetical protein